MTITQLRFKAIYDSAQKTCEYYAGKPWVEGIAAEVQAGDLVVRAQLKVEDLCLSCMNTGMIDSDGYCGNCPKGRALQVIDFALEY